MGNYLDAISFLRGLNLTQAAQLHMICGTSKLYLNRIVALFPGYTDHSFDHPQRALKILDSWLIDQEQRTYLIAHPWTAFFLTCGIFLHDIGMADLPGLPEPPKSDEKVDWIRRSHHERTYQFIVNNWQSVGFSDEFQAEIAALICLAHRKTEFSDPRIARRIPYGHAGELVDIRFAAGAVKLADELDLTFERTPFQVKEVLTALDADSEIEWAKHLAIGGVGPHDEFPGTIRVWCRSKSALLHRALKRHEAKLQGVLDEINRFISPRFPFFRVHYDIEKIGYVAEDLRFEMTFAAGLKLVTSVNLYGEPRVFLRELIQNALDACRLRAELDSDFTPRICVRMSQDLDYVVVEDNGIGMNLDSIRKYLVPVGVSFYQSSDFLALGAGRTFGFSPISAFGIGLLSCFIVAERIVISTKARLGTPITLTIADPLGYFEIENGRRDKQGTEVRVFFRDKPRDLWRYVWDTVYCPSMPVAWIDKAGLRDDIYQRSVSVKEELRTERWWTGAWKRVKEERIEFEESKGFVYLWLKQGVPEIHTGTTTVRILQEGIVVGEVSDIVPSWASRFIWGRINLIGSERLGLTLSRNEVVRDARLTQICTKTNEACLRLFEATLAAHEDLPDQEREQATDHTFAVLSNPMSADCLLPIFYRYMYFEVILPTGETRIVRLSELARIGIERVIVAEQDRDLPFPLTLGPNINSDLIEGLLKARKREGRAIAQALIRNKERFSRATAESLIRLIKKTGLHSHFRYTLPFANDTALVVRRYQAHILDRLSNIMSDRVDSEQLHLDWLFCPIPSEVTGSRWGETAPWEKRMS